MTKRTKIVKAWHFVGDTLRDGSPIPKDGTWLKQEGSVVICKSGFHGSRDPFDALQYARGPILCYVELRGDIAEQSNKLVARERRILKRMDFTKPLRYFARMQALSVIHLWKNDPPDVVLDYLMTGEESLRVAAWYAARDDARAAAWHATRSAAWGDAWDAARAAAWDAAQAAARVAAWNDAWGVAWNAARDAAWGAARDEFNMLVSECFGVEITK